MDTQASQSSSPAPTEGVGADVPQGTRRASRTSTSQWYTARLVSLDDPELDRQSEDPQDDTTQEDDQTRLSSSAMSNKSIKKSPMVMRALQRGVEGIAEDLLRKRRNTATSIRHILSRKDSTGVSADAVASSPTSVNGTASMASTGSQPAAKSSTPPLDRRPSLGKRLRRSASTRQRSSLTDTSTLPSSAISKGNGRQHSLPCEQSQHSSSLAGSQTSPLVGHTSPPPVTISEGILQTQRTSSVESEQPSALTLRKRLVVLRRLLAERQALVADLDTMLRLFGSVGASTVDSANREATPVTSVPIRRQHATATLNREYTLIAGNKLSLLPKGLQVTVSGQMCSNGRYRFTSAHRAEPTVHCLRPAPRNQRMCSEASSRSTETPPSTGGQSVGDQHIASSTSGICLSVIASEKGDVPGNGSDTTRASSGRSQRNSSRSSATSGDQLSDLDTSPARKGRRGPRSSIDGTIPRTTLSLTNLPAKLGSLRRVKSFSHRVRSSESLQRTPSVRPIQKRASVVSCEAYVSVRALLNDDSVMAPLTMQTVDFPLLGSLPASTLDFHKEEEERNEDTIIIQLGHSPQSRSSYDA
eukprot:scpid28746/ scgid13911/ 